MAESKTLELQGIHWEDVPLGTPLPCHMYDREGTLLLRAGEVVNSRRQLDDLRVEGLFIQKRGTEEAPPEPPKRSPFAQLDAVPATVERLYGWMTVEPNFSARTRAVSNVIQAACLTDRDAALGWLFLGTDARYVVAHPIHTAILGELVAAQMGWSEEERLHLIDAALTMNIGQLVAQHKLHAHAAALTPGQREDIQQHSRDGHDLLMELNVTEAHWRDAVLQHHERLDGSGYPQKLKGEAISPFARLIAVADVYCALIAEHAHRHALPPNAALKQLYLMRGTALDGAMVEQLIKLTGAYPPGTLVRLANGELAVVTHHGPSPAAPIAHSVISARNTALNVYPKRETQNPEFAIKEVLNLARHKVIINQKPRLWGYKQ
jgi:HD-GYP domain-containing protein (c-di-GMP phosphodiesterase class II)